MKSPPPNQLSLDFPAPSAKSARAELSDAASRRQGASGVELGVWPKRGERVIAIHQMYWRLTGEFLDHEYVESIDAHRGRVLLDADQAGLSESLKASLPKVLAGVALSQLRRPKP